jgi:hypothetical protein
MAKEQKKATRAAPKKKPERAATIQVAARLTPEEKADLDTLVEAHDAAAPEGYQGGGFNGWLRAIIREKTKASSKASK